MFRNRLYVAIPLIAFVSVCVLLIIGKMFFSYYTCGLLPFGHDYLCFANSADHIYTEDGPQEAFVYLNTITENLNYGASHLIAHQLGHSLWEDAGSLALALEQIPYREYSPTELFRYGGVVHGVFHSYFLMNNEQDVHALIAESCDSFVGQEKEVLLSDCIHGIGHGLMAYTNNDIQQTLALCEETLQPENCYKGAFMERGLLYIPNYADTSRLEDLSAVCATLHSTQGYACAQYAGWSAIVKDLVQDRRSDTKEALRVCDAYQEEMREECIYVAARDLFSIVYENNKEAMKSACDALVASTGCLKGIAEWDLWDAAYHNRKIEGGV